ncbi:uncharacterized protein CG4951-like [Drosophila subobscura]|uniref:uncharacterized protein CG4951-like n=1 Tax=Drosophila subobscura TaxID=7241 RepID=UPI00155A16C3|nr:uncharacterized protein CG4951-like [Drosophila subobscura]
MRSSSTSSFSSPEASTTESDHEERKRRRINPQVRIKQNPQLMAMIRDQNEKVRSAGPSSTPESENSNTFDSDAQPPSGQRQSALERVPRKVSNGERCIEDILDEQKPLDQFFYDNHLQRTDHFMGLSRVIMLHMFKRDITGNMFLKLENTFSTTTHHSSPMIHALLKLWTVRLFMDIFNFRTEEEAVQQIKDQAAYSTYMNAINNVPLEPDVQELEDKLFQ